MIAPAGRIDLRRATELGEVADQGVVEHAALREVFNQRAVTRVVHRRDDLPHALDGRERFRAVNVPGDFVEDGDEGVDRDEAHAGFNQTPREQATLSKPGQPVTCADFLRLLRQVERLTRFRARHQPVRRGKTGIHQLGVRTGLKVSHRLIHDVSQFLPTLQSHLADFARRQQIGHLEILLRRVGVEHERVKTFAEETGVLTMREVAAGWSHRFGQNNVGGQFVAPAFEVLERTTGVRRVDSARKEPSGLHHLMTGVMHRRGRVITGADQRELVRNLRVQRENLGDLDVGIIGPDRFERPADLARRVGFHVPGVQLARRAQIEDQNHRFPVIPLGDCALGLKRGEVGEREAEGAQHADLQEVASRDAVTGGNGAFAGDFEHNRKTFYNTGSTQAKLSLCRVADNRQNHPKMRHGPLRRASRRLADRTGRCRKGVRNSADG